MASPAGSQLAAGRALDRADLVVTLYDAHQAELLGYLTRYCGTPDAAEEVLQETFLRLVREVRAGRGPTQPRAWLYRVATNLAASRGRRLGILGRAMRRLSVRERVTSPQPSPEEDVLWREARDELHGALASLPDDARGALLLAAEGFSGSEIADLIGRSPLATRSLLFRARTMLRRRLSEKEPVR